MKSKSKLLGWISFIVLLVSSTAAYAKPESLQIQNPAKKQKKENAKVLARNVDLSMITDPQTRNALQAVYAALDLKDKNESFEEIS